MLRCSEVDSPNLYPVEGEDVLKSRARVVLPGREAWYRTKTYDIRYWSGDRAAALLLPTRLFGTHAANASGPAIWQACVMLPVP